jgi:hypothetical protein
LIIFRAMVNPSVICVPYTTGPGGDIVIAAPICIGSAALAEPPKGPLAIATMARTAHPSNAAKQLTLRRASVPLAIIFLLRAAVTRTHLIRLVRSRGAATLLPARARCTLRPYPSSTVA